MKTTVNLEIEQFLKDSLIESEIKFYLDKNNISKALRNDIEFLKLITDKLYLECDISNLKQSLGEDFFIGSSIDEIKEFNQRGTGEIQEDLSTFKEKIENYKIQYKNTIIKLEDLNKKINSMIITN